MKKYSILLLLILSISVGKSQIQVDHVSLKNFKANGFGGFLNFSIPTTQSDYITFEGGASYFIQNEEEVLQVPVLAGLRYTLDRSGTGFYLEPNAGYNFGLTSIQVYDAEGQAEYKADGNELDKKIKGPMAGLGIGYLFEPGGSVQFNIALRYEHSFGDNQTNMISLRISHAFTFGRRSSE